MSSNKNTIDEGLIGTDSGLINPNSNDFQALREKILEHSSQVSGEKKMRIRLKGLKYKMESHLDNINPLSL